MELLTTSIDVLDMPGDEAEIAKQWTEKIRIELAATSFYASRLDLTEIYTADEGPVFNECANCTTPTECRDGGRKC